MGMDNKPWFQNQSAESTDGDICIVRCDIENNVIFFVFIKYLSVFTRCKKEFFRLVSIELY